MAPPNDGPGSIYSRNRDDCIEAAASLFRLLCDSEKRRQKMTDRLITEDCIMAGLDHDGSLYARKTSPSARKFIKEEFEPWTAYRIHDDSEFVDDRGFVYVDDQEVLPMFEQDSEDEDGLDDE